jgi:hypothetical protein
VSTNWSATKNWSSDTIPLAGDTVIFDNTAENDASTVDPAYLSGGALGDLQIDWSGTITIDSGVTLSAHKTELTNGRMNAAGALTVSGAFTWLNGTISGTGTVNANGTLALGAGGRTASKQRPCSRAVTGKPAARTPETPVRFRPDSAYPL